MNFLDGYKKNCSRLFQIHFWQCSIFRNFGLNERIRVFEYVIVLLIGLLRLLLFKLMRLGLTKQIVDDSDFKPVDFNCRFQSDSKSNDKSKSTIAISIKIWSFSIYFLLKDLIRPSKCWLSNWKRWLLNRKQQLFNWKRQFKWKTTKIRSFLTIFNQIRPIFDINQTIFDINGLDSNRIIAASRSDRWNQIVKVD